MKLKRKGIVFLSLFFVTFAIFYTIYYNLDSIISKFLVSTIANSEEMQQFLESDEVTSVMLANIAKDLKDPNKAKEMTEEAIKNIPEESKYKLYYNLANIYFSNDMYNETIYYVNKSIELNKNCHVCFNLRGLANKDLNNIEESLNDFNSAIKLKEDRIYYLNRHLLYYRRLNLKEKGIADLVAAIKLDKTFIKAKVSLLDIYINDDNFIEANKILQTFNKDLNMELIENKAIFKIFEALIILFEKNNLFQSYELMNESLSYLLNLDNLKIGEYEYEVIKSKTIIIIKNLINFKKIEYARKSINLAKKVEDKYKNPEFREALLIQEQRLNLKLN